MILSFQIPIYPILNHFYHSMIYQTISLLCSFIGLVLLVVTGLKDERYYQLPIPQLVVIMFLFLAMFIRYMFTKVCVFLLSVLAIQRFVLYFNPTSENHWLFKNNCLRFLIYLTYCLVVFEELYFIVRTKWSVEANRDSFDKSIFVSQPYYLLETSTSCAKKLISKFSCDSVCSFNFWHKNF